MPHLMKSVSKMFKNQSNKSKAELHSHYGAAGAPNLVPFPTPIGSSSSATSMKVNNKKRTTTAAAGGGGGGGIAVGVGGGMMRQITKADISSPINAMSTHTLFGHHHRTYEMLQQQQHQQQHHDQHRNTATTNNNKMQHHQQQQQQSNDKKTRRKKSKRLIFGVPLLQLDQSRGKHPHVPRFVVDLVFYIERNFLRREGLYRVSGSSIDITTIKRALNNAYDPKLFETVDVNVLTSLLKLFFRELPESLIPPKACDLFHNKNSEQEIANGLRKIFQDLPNPRGPTIRFLIKHFVHVANFSLENRMTAHNLATVWGPTLVWVENICEIPLTSQLLKTLIQGFSFIFSEA